MKIRSLYPKKHLLLTFFSLFLLYALAACGSASGTGSTSPSGTPSTGTSGSKSGGSAQQQAESNSPTPQSTTVAMPQTQTSCPATGTTRALVTAPLALGHHQNLVYIVNQTQHNNPSSGTLKRYDMTTGAKTVIVQLTNTNIDSAQISANGQWVLFVSDNRAQKELQAVRMDGQGLQTLYCGNFQSNPQWTTNQKLIALEDSTSNTIYLLHTFDGTLEKLFTQTASGGHVYLLTTWLDDTHLYLVRTTTDANPDVLALLDITKGDNQTASNLKQIVPSSTSGQQTLSLGSFDSSYDGTQLFVNYNSCGYGCSGPSDITVQPAQGGQQHTIFSSQLYGITVVRVATEQVLLLDINNQPFGGSHVDQSHNGLWSMHTDGSSMVRLTTDTASASSYLNTTSQFPWSNVSRDASTCAALQISNLSSQQPTYAIIITSLNSGTPTTIASISDGTTLNIAGWTTM